MNAPPAGVQSVSKLCEDAIGANSNMLVPWYLILSYLYYIRDINIVGDHVFDNICVRLLSEWDNISHRHKHLICYESLKAGTGYYLTEDAYPEIVKGASFQLLKMH